MSWWTQFSAQFWADLIAGAIIMSAALYVENWLDEKRTIRQHRREHRGR